MASQRQAQESAQPELHRLLRAEQAAHQDTASGLWALTEPAEASGLAELAWT